MTRTAMLAVLAASLLLLATGESLAAPGSLDPSFGSHGVVNASVGDGIATAVLVQPDGKIVVGGQSFADGYAAVALARYDAGGLPDDSFGAGGIVRTEIEGTPSLLALALQPDGKIVAAGAANLESGQQFLLVRYLRDGRLDPSFGKGGIVLTSVGQWSSASSVLVQPDGRIVVGGAGGDGCAVARYLPNGSLDPSFGSAGVATTSLYPFVCWIKKVLFAAGGDVIAAGAIGAGFGVLRYGSNGAVDAAFGSGGHASVQVGPSDEVEDATLQPDGRIVVVGWTGAEGQWGGRWEMVLLRFLPNGALDPSFGNGGRLVDPVASNAFANTVTVDRDGRIVVAGGADDGGVRDFLVARYEPDGSPDRSFGVDGKIRTPFTSGRVLLSASADAVALQPDGKILAAGGVFAASSRRFALARYLVTPGCRVPEVAREWVGTAKDALTAEHCGSAVIHHRFSRTVDWGFVIREAPVAGTLLPEGTEVNLYVSKGRRKHRSRSR